MSTQSVKLDISQVRTEALKMFYGHVLKECIEAKNNKDLYQEYLEQKGADNK